MFRLMEGNELTIHSTMIAGGMNDLIDQEQINQAKEMGMKHCGKK